MNPGFATFLLMNNYFHDVATAMLPACALVLWLFRKYLNNGAESPVLRAYARSLYRGMVRLVWISLVWIMVSGLIRIATFDTFEWVNAAQKGYQAGLFMKYGLAAVMIVVGIIFWLRVASATREKLSS